LQHRARATQIPRPSRAPDRVQHVDGRETAFRRRWYGACSIGSRP
jgi:hypothetical protein